MASVDYMLSSLRSLMNRDAGTKDRAGRNIIRGASGRGYDFEAYPLHATDDFAGIACVYIFARNVSANTMHAMGEDATAKDFSLVITNAPGAQAWPITATNFILMRKQPRDAAAARAALDFFRWAYASGTEQAKSLDYVPLPAELVTQIEAYWAAQLK